MSKVEARNIVLVVDDSPETLRMLTDALEDADMTVLVARDGNSALAMISRITPDVILMDAVMPGMDGFETCRQFKRNQAHAHVPVIFMTGLTDTGDIVKGLEAGGVDYVTKPIVPEELIARIRVHLANARMTHSARAALDVFGRFLLAANRAGHILWCTPQAAKRLRAALPGFEGEHYTVSSEVRAWLDKHAEGEEANTPNSFALSAGGAPIKLRLSYIGQISGDEYLLRLVEGDLGGDEQVIRGKLALTAREAEVLLWITRGKSNRDVAEILSLSPRTVNKHLEQIYAKLGVENRTAAAALAMQTLNMG
jgi:DNA-binding response OmpR family regulator/DNA-binding CsgD family transcriptional regulator